MKMGYGCFWVKGLFWLRLMCYASRVRGSLNVCHNLRVLLMCYASRVRGSLNVCHNLRVLVKRIQLKDNTAHTAMNA